MPQNGEIIIYQDKDKAVQLKVKLEQETVWLNLNQMVFLFQRDTPVIFRHLHNIFRTKAALLFFKREGERKLL